MAITLGTAARNAACNGPVDLVDAAGGQGWIEIYTAGFALLLVSIEMANPAFGAAAVGVATAAGMPKSGVAVAGAPSTAAVYKVTDDTLTELWRGIVSVTGGGGDLQLDNTSIATGQTVTITAYTHTAPA